MCFIITVSLYITAKPKTAMQCEGFKSKYSAALPGPWVEDSVYSALPGGDTNVTPGFSQHNVYYWLLMRNAQGPAKGVTSTDIQKLLWGMGVLNQIKECAIYTAPCCETRAPTPSPLGGPYSTILSGLTFPLLNLSRRARQSTTLAH